MGNHYSRARSKTSTIPWTWIGVVCLILVIIFIARSFGGSSRSIDEEKPHLTITPGIANSTIFISVTDSSKNRITGTGGEPLYIGDKSVSIETGNAHAKNENISMDLDEKTEISYTGATSSGDTIMLLKGRLWFEQNANTSTIKMKNLSTAAKAGSIAILEQNNQIYSTVYALRGDILVSTSVGEYTLKAGNRIMISSSDLSNPGLQISSLVGNIDESIMSTQLFTRNNGKDIISALVGKTAVDSGSNNSGGTGASLENANSGSIRITDPIDGSISAKPSIPIKGTLSSKDIKRVTFNDQDATVSPVNGTFSFAEFPITSEVNNIVYKTYNSDGKQVEKGVITIFGSKQAVQNTNRLVPNNSPISSKDFRIISPTTNPFITTERYIKVQGLVPKDRVNYIIVNDYRLQKYLSGSPNWYYFANMDNETLREGINLYTIKFYGSSNELLYTQLFTIMKESKNETLSGESSR